MHDVDRSLVFEFSVYLECGRAVNRSNILYVICDDLYCFLPIELPADASVKSLNTKTLFVRVLPTTAEA